MVDIITIVKAIWYTLALGVGLAAIPVSIKLFRGAGPGLLWGIISNICLIFGAASAGRYTFLQLPHSYEVLPAEKRPVSEFDDPDQFEGEQVWAIRPDVVDAPGATEGKWVPVRHADSRRERLGWAWTVLTWWPCESSLAEFEPADDPRAETDGGERHRLVSVPMLYERRPQADGDTLLSAERVTKEDEGGDTSISTRWFYILAFVSLLTGVIVAFAMTL